MVFSVSCRTFPIWSIFGSYSFAFLNRQGHPSSLGLILQSQIYKTRFSFFLGDSHFPPEKCANFLHFSAPNFITSFFCLRDQPPLLSKSEELILSVAFKICFFFFFFLFMRKRCRCLPVSSSPPAAAPSVIPPRPPSLGRRRRGRPRGRSRPHSASGRTCSRCPSAG